MKLSVLPIDVNYMAKLKRYYETPDTLILVLDYIAPGCLFHIVHPYLKEKSAKILNNSIKHSHSVFTTDHSNLTKNQLDLLHNSSEEKIPSAEDDDMEFVYNLSDILKNIGKNHKYLKNLVCSVLAFASLESLVQDKTFKSLESLVRLFQKVLKLIIL